MVNQHCINNRIHEAFYNFFPVQHRGDHLADALNCLLIVILSLVEEVIN